MEPQDARRPATDTEAQANHGRKVAVTDGGPLDGEDEPDKEGRPGKHQYRRPHDTRGNQHDRVQGQRDNEEERRNDEERVLGVQGLMQALKIKPQFSSSWDEDLDTSIDIFETMA